MGRQGKGGFALSQPASAELAWSAWIRRQVYGHLLETFAVGEILKQASWSEAPVTAGHFRTEAGDEVDLILEEDLRGLHHPKERLGDRLEEAIVIYTGEHAYTHTRGTSRQVGSPGRALAEAR